MQREGVAQSFAHSMVTQSQVVSLRVCVLGFGGEGVALSLFLCFVVVLLLLCTSHGSGTSTPCNVFALLYIAMIVLV